MGPGRSCASLSSDLSESAQVLLTAELFRGNAPNMCGLRIRNAAVWVRAVPSSSLKRILASLSESYEPCINLPCDASAPVLCMGLGHFSLTTKKFWARIYVDTWGERLVRGQNINSVHTCNFQSWTCTQVYTRVSGTRHSIAYPGSTVCQVKNSLLYHGKFTGLVLTRGSS